MYVLYNIHSYVIIFYERTVLHRTCIIGIVQSNLVHERTSRGCANPTNNTTTTTRIMRPYVQSSYVGLLLAYGSWRERQRRELQEFRPGRTCARIAFIHHQSPAIFNSSIIDFLKCLLLCDGPPLEPASALVMVYARDMSSRTRCSRRQHAGCS